MKVKWYKLPTIWCNSLYGPLYTFLKLCSAKPDALYHYIQDFGSPIKSFLANCSCLFLFLFF